MGTSQEFVKLYMRCGVSSYRTVRNNFQIENYLPRGPCLIPVVKASGISTALHCHGSEVQYKRDPSPTVYGVKDTLTRLRQSLRGRDCQPNKGEREREDERAKESWLRSGSNPRPGQSRQPGLGIRKVPL